MSKIIQALTNSNFKQLHVRQVFKECTVYRYEWSYT